MAMDLSVFGDKQEEIQFVLDKVQDLDQGDIEDLNDSWDEVEPPIYDIVPSVAFADSLEGIMENEWVDLVAEMLSTTEAFPFNDTEFQDPGIAKAEYAAMYRLFSIVFEDYIAIEDYDDLTEVWDYWLENTDGYNTEAEEAILAEEDIPEEPDTEEPDTSDDDQEPAQTEEHSAEAASRILEDFEDENN